ncbi:unnamed protein product [Schistosoma mattheei]|uniref:Uncharacterized protein n=1 Tax=Schistosoma mattheei TaxID=31246 RepID=A0A183ND62_9TREM|nr:unnamed protein product [Schistosoma mattheei]
MFSYCINAKYCGHNWFIGPVRDFLLIFKTNLRLTKFSSLISLFFSAIRSLHNVFCLSNISFVSSNNSLSWAFSHCSVIYTNEMKEIQNLFGIW